MEFEDFTDKSVIKGGPLEYNYQLKNSIFTGGPSMPGAPSILFMDSKCYLAELHLVHWNAVKFESFEDAALEENGLAVIGVFLEVKKVTNIK